MIFTLIQRLNACCAFINVGTCIWCSYYTHTCIRILCAVCWTQLLPLTSIAHVHAFGLVIIREFLLYFLQWNGRYWDTKATVWVCSQILAIQITQAKLGTSETVFIVQQLHGLSLKPIGKSSNRSCHCTSRIKRPWTLIAIIMFICYQWQWL